MPRRLRERWPLLIAIATILLWLILLNLIKPGPIADERFHYGVIEGLMRGQEPAPDFLGMPPTFHRLMAALLAPIGPSLATARVLVATLSVLALVALDFAARLRWGPHGRFAVLLWAWNPLFLPFSVLVYTEPLVLALFAGAILLLAARRPLFAYGVIAFATAIRQSSPVWMLAPWLCAESQGRGAARGSRERRDVLRHRLGLSLGIAVTISVLAWNHGLEHGGDFANVVRFNIAQPYVFAAVFGLIFLPLLAVQLGRDAEYVLRRLSRPSWTAAAVALAGLGVRLFANPHPFNDDTDYLRNHLLMAMSRSGLILAAVVAFDLLTCLAVGLFAARCANRHELVVVLVCGAVYLAPHWLVDPRYYLPFLLWFTLTIDWWRERARALLAWDGCLSVLAAAYVLVRGTIGSGIW